MTTNPLLLAQRGESVEQVLVQIKEFGFPFVFYQVMGGDSATICAEVGRAKAILGDSLVVKIPPTDIGFGVLAELSKGYPCCLTALFSVRQAVVAAECGATYVAPYVSRATKHKIDGVRLVSDMAAALRGTPTQILAASLKTPEDVELTLRAGAQHVTTSFEVLQGLPYHELSEEAARVFVDTGKGLK